ncbi:MAG: UvrB/UvrC motif-containing protein [Clostridia bacterium]|nr:UvrB/UvrC motif-containing protein [Clostridia bacterium]
MLCQHCQKRTANVHFTQVVNNNKIELYLCEQCANEKGKMNFASPLSIGNFFSGLMSLGHASPYIINQGEELLCNKCGMSFEDFQKEGKIGCSECYEVFSERLQPILKRLHGNVEHHGKVPQKVFETVKASREIERLKASLNKAIQAEEYEKAAEIRDKIRLLETGGK